MGCTVSPLMQGVDRGSYRLSPMREKVKAVPAHANEHIETIIKEATQQRVHDIPVSLVEHVILSCIPDSTYANTAADTVLAALSKQGIRWGKEELKEALRELPTTPRGRLVFMVDRVLLR